MPLGCRGYGITQEFGGYLRVSARLSLRQVGESSSHCRDPSDLVVESISGVHGSLLLSITK